MRLDVMQLPQAVHRVLADPLRLRHEPATPMRHASRLALQRRFNDPASLGLSVVRLASPARRDLPHLPNPPLVNALAPQLHGRPIHFKLLGNRDIVLTRQRSQNNPAAQRHLLRGAVGGLPLLKLRSFSRRQFDRQTYLWHEPHHSNPREILHSYLRDTTLGIRSLRSR